jgi:hypothetical protein
MTTRGSRFPGGDGEVLSGALRLGTSVADRWGVELEFAVPQKLESDALNSGIAPLVTGGSPNVVSGTIVPPVGSGGNVVSSLFPFVAPRVRVERRNVTLSSVAWVRQRVSNSVDLAYVGGLDFSRVTQLTEFSFGPIPLAGALLVQPQRSRTISYGVGPVVGMEARIGLTDHVRLVPAVRLHGLDEGWLVRPTVGLGWWF